METSPEDSSPRTPEHHARRAASFGPAAGVYQAVRPSYPDEALAWVLSPDARVLVDLAAGTGKLTERLIALAADVPDRHVVAVEPSEGMRAALAQALPEVDVRVGSAEATGLPDASADLITVGQAWHWFDEPAAAAEAARVLRPGGTLAVIWNERDTTVDWLAQYDEIVRRGDAMSYGHPVPVLGEAFGPVERTAVAWSDTMRPSDLRALAASRSHLLTLPAPQRDALLDEVDVLAATHPDLRGRELVAVPYVTDVFRARRR